MSPITKEFVVLVGILFMLWKIYGTLEAIACSIG